MSDDRNFIERAQSISENWTGEGMSPDELVSEFQLYSPAKRALALDELDGEYANADTSDLRKFHELSQMRRQMRKVHHALRKVGR